MQIAMTVSSDQVSSRENRQATAIHWGAPAASDERLVAVDVVRGVAIAGVVVFHLVWDLDLNGMIPAGIADHWAWLLFGRVLAGTFMVLVGVGLVLSHGRHTRWRPFFRRVSMIAAAAILISAVTWYVFPLSFVYFGILQAILVASLLGIFLLRLPLVLVVGIGVMMVALPQVLKFSGADERWLAWIGLSERVPPSVDFVPVFPWVGLSVLGIAAARLALSFAVDHWLRARNPTGSGSRAIALLGRHSLLIYLVHQPVLLGAVMTISAIA